MGNLNIHCSVSLNFLHYDGINFNIRGLFGFFMVGNFPTGMAFSAANSNTGKCFYVLKCSRCSRHFGQEICFRSNELN